MLSIGRMKFMGVFRDLGILGNLHQCRKMVGWLLSHLQIMRRKPIGGANHFNDIGFDDIGACTLHAYSFKILTLLKTNILLMEDIWHHLRCIYIKPDK